MEATIDGKSTDLEFIEGYRISNRYSYGLFLYEGNASIVGISDSLKKKYTWASAKDDESSMTVEEFRIVMNEITDNKLRKKITLYNFQSKGIFI